MMIIKSCSLFFVLIILASCIHSPKEEKWRKVFIQPKDQSQIITIITENNKRYFMNGEHHFIPEDDYLLLDISKVDPLGDAIGVCWDDFNYKWKIYSAYAKLLENKLDTSRYLYFQPLGEYGEPVSDGYSGSNCGSILLREEIGPRGNLIMNFLEK